MFEPEELDVRRLGRPEILSPLLGRQERFIDDDERVLLHSDARLLDTPRGRLTFERAGPREKILFDPAEIACGIVTCGGLCPGLNDVIRSTVASDFVGISTCVESDSGPDTRRKRVLSPAGLTLFPAPASGL